MGCLFSFGTVSDPPKSVRKSERQNIEWNEKRQIFQSLQTLKWAPLDYFCAAEIFGILLQSFTYCVKSNEDLKVFYVQQCKIQLFAIETAKLII